MDSTPRSIALQLRKLAGDKEGATFLAAEPACLSGLIALLNGDNDPETLQIALQSVSLLASYSSSRAALLRQPTLTLRLAELTEVDDNNVAKTAQAAIDAIHSSTINQPIRSTKPGLTTVDSNKPAQSNNHPSSSQSGAPAKSRTRYLSTIILEVRQPADQSSSQLTPALRTRLEHMLVTLPGVVSVSCSATGQVNLHSKSTSTPSEIEQMCQQAVKGEFIIKLADQSTNKPTIQSAQPATLDKENQLDSTWSSSRAIVASASLENATLQSRFQSRSKADIANQLKQNKAKGLFSSVTSFFW